MSAVNCCIGLLRGSRTEWGVRVSIGARSSRQRACYATSSQAAQSARPHPWPLAVAHASMVVGHDLIVVHELLPWQGSSGSGSASGSASAFESARTLGRQATTASSDRNTLPRRSASAVLGSAEPICVLVVFPPQLSQGVCASTQDAVRQAQRRSGQGAASRGGVLEGP